jgi:hypothetical protein
MQIDVRIEGLEKLQAGVAAAPATLTSEVRMAMTAGSLLVEGAARSLAPKDTGRLAGSITHAISGGGASLTSRIGPSVAYGLYVERGRRPGKPPPVSAIGPWARRRGANPFLVARGIGRKGTRPRPFLVPALTQSQGRIVALFMKVGATVVARMAG